jgi:hypothetical protein
MCKDAVNRDSTCQSIFRRLCTVKKIDDFRFPISRPDDVSSCLDDVSSHPEARQTSIISPDHCIEKLMFQLASVRTFQQHVRTPLSTRTVSDSFQVPRNGRSIDRLDEVVSRPNAHLRKARIAIQISPSEHLTALVQTRVQLIWKLPIGLQPSRRLSLMLRMRALQIWKLCVEELPSRRSSPLVRTHEALYGNYLQRTCDRPDVNVSPSGLRS